MNNAIKTVTTTGHHAHSPSNATLDKENSDWSAFLDGELTAEQSRSILKNLHNDAEGKERFATYCAIGDTLRGHADMGHSADFTQRVMAALEHEPTIMAPMRKASNRRPAVWLAAAAVSAITWGLWAGLPEDQAAIPFAVNTSAPANANPDISPYLAAHQDFAQAVLAPAEMNFTQISLAQANP